MSAVICRHIDAKAFGYCNQGLRRFFSRTDVTFDLFRRQGISTDWLRATGDAMAIRLAEYVESRHASDEDSSK